MPLAVFEPGGKLKSKGTSVCVLEVCLSVRLADVPAAHVVTTT